MQEMQNEPEPDDGDTEAWAAIEGEFGSEGEGEGEAERAAEPEANAAPGDEPAEGDGKPDPETLARQYQAGMREERVRRQQLEAQIAEINQAIAEARQGRNQEQFEPPSIDDDPVAYFEHQQRVLAEQIQHQGQTLEQERMARAQIEQQTQFTHALASQEQAFAEKTPDYFEAADHLRDTRLSQLEAIYPSTPEGDALAHQYGYPSADALRNAHLEQEVSQYAAQAFQMGRNPAEVFYQLAKSTGWAGSQQPTPQQRADVARAGVKRAQSLSGGGGGAGNTGNATASELADLYLTDPEAADKLFDKLSAQGALG